jgi:predicted nucleotidyltransferase
MDTTTTFARHGITFPADRMVELCRKYQVVELSVFGSLLREDFGPDSDVDFLVVFQDDDNGPWMEKLQRLEEDLSALLGREVEVVPKESVVQSENWIRRNHILSTAQVIYGS